MPTQAMAKANSRSLTSYRARVASRTAERRPAETTWLPPGLVLVRPVSPGSNEGAPQTRPDGVCPGGNSMRTRAPDWKKATARRLGEEVKTGFQIGLVVMAPAPPTVPPIPVAVAKSTLAETANATAVFPPTSAPLDSLDAVLYLRRGGPTDWCCAGAWHDAKRESCDDGR